MGRVYLQQPDERVTYHCKRCHTYLAKREMIKSTSFQGATGAAFLFDEVVNVDFKAAEVREMLTGTHYVRDIICKGCRVKLGWMYEFAMNESQRYKEGRFILEKALMVENTPAVSFPMPRSRCTSNTSSLDSDSSLTIS